MPFNKILLQEKEELFGSLDLGDYKIGYFIKQKKTSSVNDDSLFIAGVAKDFILGVCDGAGGHPNGNHASSICSESILDSYEKEGFNHLEAIELANEKIKKLKTNSLTTMSYIHVKNDLFQAFNIGDSEVLFWNSNGELVYYNIPQSIVGYDIEAGNIEQDESLHSDDRYIVNNMMGDSAIRIESTTRMSLKKGYSILIGTDGLFDNISHSKLTDMLSMGLYEDNFKQLCDFCITQKSDVWLKDDDIAFIYLRKLRA